jgi:hypothetical protein
MNPTTPQLDLFPTKRGRMTNERLFGPVDRLADAITVAAEEARHLRVLIDAPELLPAHRARIREAARVIGEQTALAADLVNLFRAKG